MSEQGGAGLLTLTGRPQGAVAEQGAPAEVERDQEDAVLTRTQKSRATFKQSPWKPREPQAPWGEACGAGAEHGAAWLVCSTWCETQISFSGENDAF